MTRNSIMIDLNDPKAEKIADVLSNKTAKRILGLLADGEMSGSDVASELKMPLNTATYNLKKLVESGLVDRSKRFFWSSKGKRIELYKVSNKRIVIMPKKIVRGVLPAILVSGVAALGIRIWTQARIKASSTAQNFVAGEKTSGGLNVGAGEGVSAVAGGAAESARTAVQGGTAAIPESAADSIITETVSGPVVESLNQTVVTIAQNAWLWFLIGALSGLLVYLLWNWRKR